MAQGSITTHMSMRPLLLWATDKWTSYETNREVTVVTISRNGLGWYHLVPISALGHGQEGWIWYYLTWRARWKIYAIDWGCSKDTFGSSRIQKRKWQHPWKDEKLISSIRGRHHTLLVVSKYLCGSVPVCVSEVGLIGRSLLWPFSSNGPRWYHPNGHHCCGPE
jgi:hypothetical protein